MSTQTHNGFDPYRAWLNVRAVHRPLTAYQLLGLNALEDDPKVIRSAAGLQRMAIQTHRHEAPPAVWEQVFRELEQAIEILLDPDKKAAYDVALQMQGEPETASQASPAAITGREQGGLVRCPKCNWRNPAVRKFCAHCGTHLWEPCFDCGSLSLAGDRYCGACGANLIDGLGERREEFEVKLAQAEELRAASRYDEAIAELASVGKVEHPRLRPYADRARKLTIQLAAERDGHRAQAKEKLEQARQRAADRDYEAATALLQSIPPALRDKEAGKLLEESEARLAEIASLHEELGSAIACQRNLHLLPKVARLLTLKPDHGRARELAERFQQRACRVAEERLAHHDYEGALRVLDQVPEPVRDGQVDALRARAAELAWLATDLRHAPRADPTLARLAQRFQKLAPGNQRAAKLAEEVRRRARLTARDPRRGFVAWAPAPARTYFGYPIDWMTGFRRIRIKDELAASIFTEHPGRLYVACGLALQGLGLAPARLNLLPKEGNASTIGRIAGILNEDPLSWMGRKRAPRTAWGLDLSTSGLKAVKLARHGEKGGVVIEDFCVIPHRKALTEAFSEEETRTLIEETVHAFCLQTNVKADRTCMGLASRMLLTRRFAIPSLEPARLEKAVAYEARRQIPLPLEEVAWDYAVMEPGASENSAKKRDEILIVAARRPQLVDRLSTLRRSSLRVDLVGSDCLALHNFLVYDRLGREQPGESDGSDGRGPLAVLDVGSDQTHLVVSSPSFVWFRSSGFGGEQFTRALVRELQLTATRAEELKRHPERAESLHGMYGCLEPVLEALVSDARSLLDAFAKRHESLHVERVLGCGGTFQLHGLLRYLRSGF
jgi:type IV pilus assembly protein PilM